LKVLEILTNMTAARKGWKLYCSSWWRFHEDYADDTPEYTKYID